MMENLQKIAAGSVEWNMESYPDYQDFLLLPFLVLYFPILRFILDRLIFEVSLILQTPSIFYLE